MGIFDQFKKKVNEVSEETNPMFNVIKNANLAIENLEVDHNGGEVIVNGSVEDGSILEEVNGILAMDNRVNSFDNRISIADVSHLGIQYKVATKHSNLNCRKGPGTNFDIVGKFKKDAVVNLVKRENKTWHLVRGEDVQGYCHTDYLDHLHNT